MSDKVGIKRAGSLPVKKEDQHEVVEIYPSELSKLKSVSAGIQKRHGMKPFSESSKAHFVDEVNEKFREIGFIVQVTWDLDVSGGSDSNIFYIPSISIVGRTESTTIDHERLSHEIASGEADGKAGYIREDGTLHEDKIRTIL